MSDPWRNYDRWKTRSPEDEEDEQERRLQRAQDLEDRADELYQRYVDGDLDRPDIDRARRRAHADH